MLSSAIPLRICELDQWQPLAVSARSLSVLSGLASPASRQAARRDARGRRARRWVGEILSTYPNRRWPSCLPDPTRRRGGTWVFSVIQPAPESRHRQPALVALLARSTSRTHATGSSQPYRHSASPQTQAASLLPYRCGRTSNPAAGGGTPSHPPERRRRLPAARSSELAVRRCCPRPGQPSAVARTTASAI